MLPALAQQAHVAAVDMSPVMVAAGAGGVAGAALCPLLPLSTLLPGGLLTLAATFALVPLADSVTQFAGIFALAAVCSQGVAVGGHALIARQMGRTAGVGLNGINAAFGAGSLLAPLMHSSLATSLPLRGGAPSCASYWAVATMLAVAATPFVAGAFARPARSAGVAASVDPSPALTTSSIAPAPPSASSISASARRALRALGGVDGAALTVSIMGLVACCVGAETCFGVWLYTYASQGPLALPPAVAAASVSAFWASLTGGRLLAVAASSRMSPAGILRASLPLAVAGPVAALAFPSSAAALTGGVALAGLGLSCGFANAVALLARHVPPSGSTQALIQLAACSGGLVFAPLVARLAGSGVLGPDAFLYVAGSCAAADIVCLVAAEALAARLAGKHKALRGAEQP